MTERHVERCGHDIALVHDAGQQTHVEDADHQRGEDDDHSDHDLIKHCIVSNTNHREKVTLKYY